MRSIALSFLFSTGLLAVAAAWAAEEDPLKSAACGQALATLEQARRDGGDAAQARSQAARICLGATGPAGRTARPSQPPVSVPPTAIRPPAPPAAVLPPPASPPPPVAIDRPAMPAQCDAAGCWVNDGTHLRHVAPGAAGPRGPCVPQAGLVYCP